MRDIRLPNALRGRPLTGSLLFLTLLLTSGCATLQQLTALQNVDFALDGVSRVELAGIDVTTVREYSDLSLLEVAAIANAIRQNTLPLVVDVQVAATNPPTNGQARIIQMDWTLFLEERETVSGRLNDEIVIPRDGTTVFPVTADLNLVDFFEGSARDLVDVALSIAGVGGSPREISLTALPTIQTALGPIRYDRPIRIVGATVGQ